MSAERIQQINEMFDKLKEHHNNLELAFQSIAPKLSADVAELFYLYEIYVNQTQTLAFELWKMLAVATEEMTGLREKAWMYDNLCK